MRLALVEPSREPGGQDCAPLPALRLPAAPVTQRAAKPAADSAAVRRVIAIDLPPPPPLADDAAAERQERAALAKALAAELRRLVMAVAAAEDTWRDAAAPVVRAREGREERREWLRLVLRAWREVADGRRAGAARCRAP